MNYLGLAWLVGFDFNTFIQLLFSGYFLVPALTTLYVTVAAMTIGIALGLLGGLGKLSKFPLVRWVVNTYLWVFRGTPVLVQIIFWYDATAELTGNVVNLPALVAGILALGVNEGAYMTEIVRAGLLVSRYWPARGRSRRGHDLFASHAAYRHSTGIEGHDSADRQ